MKKPMKQLTILCMCTFMSVFLLLGCSDNSQQSDTSDSTPANETEGTTPDGGAGDENAADEGSGAEGSEGSEDTEGTEGAGVATGYTTVTDVQASLLMKEAESFIMVDVRNQEEYNANHIAEAILIPLEELEGRAEAELPDKDGLILVYCREDVRGKEASQLLFDLGYTNVNYMGPMYPGAGPFEYVGS